MLAHHRSNFDCTKALLIRRMRDHGSKDKKGKYGFDSGEKDKIPRTCHNKDQHQLTHGDNFLTMGKGASYQPTSNQNPYIFCLYTELAEHTDVKNFGKHIYSVDVKRLKHELSKYFTDKLGYTVHCDSDFVKYGRTVVSHGFVPSQFKGNNIPGTNQQNDEVFVKQLPYCAECEYRIAIYVPENLLSGDQTIKGDWLKEVFIKGENYEENKQ